MNLRDKLNFLNQSLDDSLAQYQQESPYPYQEEIGLRNEDSGIHIRDDGVVEIHAGETKIVLDPQTNTIVLDAPHIIGLSKEINLIADNDKIGISNKPINSAWYPDPILGLQKAVIPKLPISLDHAWVSPTPLVVDGVPLVPLSKYLDSKPIFLNESFSDTKNILSSLLNGS